MQCLEMYICIDMCALDSAVPRDVLTCEHCIVQCLEMYICNDM